MALDFNDENFLDLSPFNSPGSQSFLLNDPEEQFPNIQQDQFIDPNEYFDDEPYPPPPNVVPEHPENQGQQLHYAEQYPAPLTIHHQNYDLIGQRYQELVTKAVVELDTLALKTGPRNVRHINNTLINVNRIIKPLINARPKTYPRHREFRWYTGRAINQNAATADDVNIIPGGRSRRMPIRNMYSRLQKCDALLWKSCKYRASHEISPCHWNKQVHRCETGLPPNEQHQHGLNERLREDESYAANPNAPVIDVVPNYPVIIESYLRANDRERADAYLERIVAGYELKAEKMLDWLQTARDEYLAHHNPQENANWIDENIPFDLNGTIAYMMREEDHIQTILNQFGQFFTPNIYGHANAQFQNARAMITEQIVPIIDQYAQVLDLQRTALRHLLVAHENVQNEDIPAVIEGEESAEGEESEESEERVEGEEPMDNEFEFGGELGSEFEHEPDFNPEDFQDWFNESFNYQ